MALLPSTYMIWLHLVLITLKKTRLHENQQLHQQKDAIKLVLHVIIRSHMSPTHLPTRLVTIYC